MLIVRMVTDGYTLMSAFFNPRLRQLQTLGQPYCAVDNPLDQLTN